MKTNKEKIPKVKFRVGAFISIISLCLLIAGAFFLIVFYFWSDLRVASIPIQITMAIMLLLLPFGLFLWGLFVMWPVVTINEIGLHKALFKKLFKRTILWEEIKDLKVIKTIGSSAAWVFFSKSSLDGLGITRCRLKRDNIFIFYSKELNEAIKKYYGREIPITSDRV